VPRCSVDGTVIEHIGGLGSLASIEEARCDAWVGTGVGTVALDDAQSDPGTRFTAQGWLVPLTDDSFDRARRRLGARADLHATSFEEVADPRGLNRLAASMRAGSRAAVSGIDPVLGAVLQGLTIGETSGIPPEVVEEFRASGLSHVLAVSGSNVAIVLGAVLASVRSLGHRTRVIASFAALALFVMVVGPDASVLRAGVMGAITLACLARGLQAEPLAALGLAVIAVIAIRPGMLFSAGLHLSVAATAGIVLLNAPIAARLTPLWEPLRLMLAATLAAQIAVAPVLVITFGEIPLLAPLANALALPAVAIATVVGLAAVPAAILWAPLGTLLSRVVAPAVAWIIVVAEHVGGVAAAVAEVPEMWGWIGLVAVAAWGCHVLRRGVAR
jgi:competence protein ComEC